MPQATGVKACMRTPSTASAAPEFARDVPSLDACVLSPVPSPARGTAQKWGPGSRATPPAPRACAQTRRRRPCPATQTAWGPPPPACPRPPPYARCPTGTPGSAWRANGQVWQRGGCAGCFARHVRQGLRNGCRACALLRISVAAGPLLPPPPLLLLLLLPLSLLWLAQTLHRAATPAVARPCGNQRPRAPPHPCHGSNLRHDTLEKSDAVDMHI